MPSVTEKQASLSPIFLNSLKSVKLQYRGTGTSPLLLFIPPGKHVAQITKFRRMDNHITYMGVYDISYNLHSKIVSPLRSIELTLQQAAFNSQVLTLRISIRLIL